MQSWVCSRGPSSPNSLIKRLDGGRAVNHTGHAGFTTLHSAVLGGRTDALPPLADEGAPIDAVLVNTHGRYSWNVPLDYFERLSRELFDNRGRLMALFQRQQRHLLTLLSAGDTALAVAAR